MNQRNPSVFERHPRITIVVFLICVFAPFVVVVEIVLRHRTGLGNPPLYVLDPYCGFRLQPNQEMERFGGAKFIINNLALRAQVNWDKNIEDKILFLGDSVTHGGNHISNSDLFSAVAVENIPGFMSGNAGLPNWGVENVYGLIVDKKFLPAKTYVSTFIEDDFYRGLVLPENKPWIMVRSPRFALIELARFVWYKWVVDPVNRIAQKSDTDSVANEIERERRSEKATRELKEMDDFLKSRDYRHLIYISPRIGQVLGTQEKDDNVFDLLRENDLSVTYIVERLDLIDEPQEVKASWFQDDAHLTENGHKVWGELIAVDLKRTLGLS